mmetsp:Transcript_8582/g.14544  ORF Transcript_8582/g.14544 Transcript_8582/m.14544 type:complete len:218 (-) Transcript_8582:103-756(-)
MSTFAEALAKRRAMEKGDIWASNVWQDAIYLGAGRDAKNLRKLQMERISHILNCADDVPNFHEDSFSYGNLQITDFGGEKCIREKFDFAAQFVRQAVEERGKVLIHCANGSNRSATIAIAVMMINNEWTLEQAWQQVTSARPECAPLRDNRKQLLEFEMIKIGKNTMREDSARLVPCPECSHNNSSNQTSISVSEASCIVETDLVAATTDSFPVKQI